MERLVLFLGACILAGSLSGCNSDAPPPADGSNLPPEVKAEEEKFEAANAKRKAEADKRAARGR